LKEEGKKITRAGDDLMSGIAKFRKQNVLFVSKN
jgi:hypothetical protein